jgi:hypothetical protein
MRVLAQDRTELIEALDTETDLGNVTTALLEKDEQWNPIPPLFQLSNFAPLPPDRCHRLRGKIRPD